jgi:hypothetical protein
MRKVTLLFVGLFSLAAATAAIAAPYQFVSEYVRELGAIESIRARAEKELSGSANETMATCVRNSTRFNLELTSQSAMISRMVLAAPLADLPSKIASLYDDKAAIHQKLSDLCATMMAGPKPNVDYGALSAEAPKLNAQLEFIDKTLFQVTPLIFAALIDPVPDAQNHMSRLVITATERDALVRSLDSYFGKKLDAPDQNYTVSAASVLKGYLTKKGYTTK